MASEYAISKTTLTGIADAIREKTETTGTMTPGQMPSKIRSINGGGSGGVQSVEVTQIQSTGTKIASINVDGTSTDLYAPNGGGGGSTVSVTQVLSSGTKAATITVDGVGTDIYAPTQPDVTGKADKVANATNGHFAALDSNGNLTDSGHQHSDYLTQHQDISGKLDAPSTAGTSGQVLKLDSNLNPVWGNESGGGGTVTDVQVDSVSVVTNGVANVPLASSSSPGVVKVSSQYGVEFISSGNRTLKLTHPNDSEIKAGAVSVKAVTPDVQHAAAFYGLAKAAGDATQAASENAVGTYTDGAKTAIKSMLGVTDPTVTDVQVNGTSVVSNGVANVPIASSSDPGVIIVGTNSYGLELNSGTIKIVGANDTQIKDPASNILRPIVPSQQHKSVFYGLAKAAGDVTQVASSNPVGTYTDAAKAAIQAMIGAGVEVVRLA